MEEKGNKKEIQEQNGVLLLNLDEKPIRIICMHS